MINLECQEETNVQPPESYDYDDDHT